MRKKEKRKGEKERAGSGGKRFMHSKRKQRILLLLASGVALSLTRSPKQYFRIIKVAARTWKEIDRHFLYRSVREFYQERLIDFQEQGNGIIRVVLSEKGERRVLSFNFDELEIPQPSHWDKIWRLVLFDIPEKKKASRNALREKLKDLGFLEWQKSVWIFPYPCRDQINFVVEFFEVVLMFAMGN